MDNITIKKATISAGYGLKVVYTQKEGDGSITEISRDCSAPVHEDLQKAFDKFNIHLGVISEFIDADDIKDIDRPKHELLDSFKVKEFEIDGDNSGMKLGGYRKLSTKKHLALKTPTVKCGDKNPYVFTSNMAEAVEQVKYEIDAYLDGKHAPESQLAMAFPDGVGDGEEDSPI